MYLAGIKKKSSQAEKKNRLPILRIRNGKNRFWRFRLVETDFANLFPLSSCSFCFFFFFFFFTIETRRHASTPIILFVVVPQQKGEQKCSVTKIDNAMRRFLYAHQRNSSIDKTCRVWWKYVARVIWKSRELFFFRGKKLKLRRN